MSYGIRLHVSGPRALFTRPELKVERVSYDVMTPSAARGMLEAIHWKPAIRWVIDRIHVLKPIRFQSLRRNEVSDKASASLAKSAMKRGDLDGLGIVVEDARQQRASLLLVDVAYVIEAHFEMTPRAGAEDNAAKHYEMFTRRAERGQCFHQPALGTRECVADFELVAPDAPLPSAIPLDQDLGLMLWDIDHGAPGKPSLFFRARLQQGVLHVPQPGSPEVLK
jgi:CRISPR-associated protein Cas5d